MNCPICGAEDMQPDEISVGMCYDCGRHELEKKELRDRIKCLESENAALNLALFHVDNGLSHPDERVRKLIEAARIAKEATP